MGTRYLSGYGCKILDKSPTNIKMKIKLQCAFVNKQLTHYIIGVKMYTYTKVGVIGPKGKCPGHLGSKIDILVYHRI